MTTCNICGKPLTDPISIKLRVGPDCAKKWASFCAGGIDSAVISSLEEHIDPDVQRFLRTARRAVACGHNGRAKSFLEYAMKLALAASIPVMVGEPTLIEAA